MTTISRDQALGATFSRSRRPGFIDDYLSNGRGGTVRAGLPCAVIQHSPEHIYGGFPDWTGPKPPPS